MQRKKSVVAEIKTQTKKNTTRLIDGASLG